MQNKLIKKALPVLTAGGLLLSSTIIGQASKSQAQVKDQTKLNLSIAQLQDIAKQLVGKDDNFRTLVPSEIDVKSTKKVNLIVQFNEEPVVQNTKESKSKQASLSSNTRLNKLQEEHSQFKEQFLQNKSKSVSNGISLKREFMNLFNGVAIEIPANKVPELLSSNVVKSIFMDSIIQVEPTVKQQASSDSPAESENFPLIGVDKLHAEGITGKHIKIGVLDTGIDYNHPDLKDAFKGGYDFVDNDSDPMETTYNEWKKSGKSEFSNGSPYYTFHGTHVSGTIVGQKKNKMEAYSVEGVAPDSDLYVYRVLGSYGSGSTSQIMAGIEKAVADKMDVINLSLGATINDPFAPLSVALNNAMLSGTVAVVSAGNSGDKLYTLGSPGTGALPITVGASSSPVKLPTIKGTYKNTKETSIELKFIGKNYTDNLSNLKNKSAEIVDLGKGLATDFQNKTIKDKIVVVNYGYVTPATVVKTAKDNGALAVFFESPTDSHVDYFMGDGNQQIPTFSIKYSDGELLKAGLKNPSATFTFNTIDEIEKTGDVLASFSSRGPVWLTYDIKPEVTAPGVNVYSTIPSYMDGGNGNYDYSYDRYSGTSMASPHVAGVVALLKGAHPNLSPLEIKSILMNTADSLSKPYSVYEVGAGRIDAFEAVHSNIEIMVHGKSMTEKDGQKVEIENPTGSLNFGGIYHHGNGVESQQEVSIKNTGKEEKQFKTEVVFQSGVRNSLDAHKNGVTLDVPNEVTVAASNQITFNASLHVPKSANVGSYEGYVVFTNTKDNSETYQIPFGVRMIGEGILDPVISPSIFTTKPQNHPFAVNKTSITTQFLEPNIGFMVTSLKDAKTNQELGLIGMYMPSTLQENLNYKMEFNGEYYPLIDENKGTISDTKIKAPSGDYIIETQALATTLNGEIEYDKQTKVTIDNKQPEIDMENKDRIIEVKENEKININGRFYGPYKEVGSSVYAVDTLQPSGTYTNLPVKKEGQFSFETNLKNGELVKQVSLLPLDVAKNGYLWNPETTYTLIKKGTQYIYPQITKSEISEKDSLAINVKLANVNALKSSQLTLSIPVAMNIEDIQINPMLNLAANLQKNKFDITVGNPIVVGNKKEIQIELKADNDKLVEIPKNISLVNIKLKQDPTKFIKGPQEIGLKECKISKDSQSISSITSFPQYVNIIPSVSSIKSRVIAGAFSFTGMTEEKFKNLNGNVLAIDKIGKTYSGNFLKNGDIQINDIPANVENVEVEVKVPGHFPTKLQVNELNDLIDSKYAGSLINLPNTFLTPGDINGDNVIDVMDAVEIKKYWGTDNRSADINFDGIVNKQDMWSVYLNYLAKNPTTLNVPQPIETYNGQTLQDIMNELGIKF